MKTLVTTIICVLMKKKILVFPNLSFRTSIISVSITIMLAMHSILIPAYGQWKRHIIDSKLENNYTPGVYDVDADGDMDVFSSNYGVNMVFLYWNNNMTWSKDTIDDDLWGTENLDLADFDNDGNIDVVAEAYYADVIAVYMNSGGEPIKWTKEILDSSLDGAAGVIAEDMNGDGSKDVVSCGLESGEVVWYENNLPDNWSRHVISTKGKARGIVNVADINKDNKPDVIFPNGNLQEIVLFKNNLPDSVWTEIVIDGDINGAFMVQCDDVDIDGDMDIIATLEENPSNIDLVWYENQGLDKVWIRHVISTELTSAFVHFDMDFNNDGFIDFVVTDRPEDDVILFLNEDGGQTWTKYIIDDNLKGANCPYPADIDLDGDYDIITSSKYDVALVWYENPGPVNFEDYSFLLSDTVFNPGDSLEIKLTLKNNGSTDTVTNIKARLISLDTLVSVPGYNRSFEDIPAGDSSISDGTYLIKISEQCTNTTQVSIVINITGDRSTFWRDTFFIDVQVGPDNIEDIRKPITRIYPNPTDNMLNIEISNMGKQGLAIEILDITGTLIYQNEYKSIGAHFVEQLDLSGYANGIYLVKVKQANSVYVGKVVVR